MQVSIFPCYGSFSWQPLSMSARPGTLTRHSAIIVWTFPILLSELAGTILGISSSDVFASLIFGPSIESR
jgi:hypothetical protein